MLIQAGAEWCGQCTMLQPICLEEVKKHEGKVAYIYIDVDQFQEVAQMLGVQNIPMCYMVSKGELVGTMPGLKDEQAVATLI